MKSSAKTLFVFAAIFFLALSSQAEPVSQLHPTGYVNDFAHVLDPSTFVQLNDVCKQIDDRAHAQIAVVTIQSLDGADIDSYAVDLFKQWGVGGKASNRGVLILLAVQDHRYRTEVGYGLEPILPDGKVGGFGREAVPLLKQGDFNGAISLMTARVAAVIAQDAGITLTGAPEPEPMRTRHRSDAGPSLVSIIFWIIIIIVFLAVPPLRSLLFYFFLFGGGGGRGDRSGGGFGGGGGGFGGFGGGSSGGGGASGSW